MFASLPDLPAGEGVALVHLGTWQTTSSLLPPVSKLSSSYLSTKKLRGDERAEKFHITMAFTLLMRTTASSLSHQLLLLGLKVPAQRKIVRWLRISTQIVRL